MTPFFLQLNEFLLYGVVKIFLVYFIIVWSIWLTKLFFAYQYKDYKQGYETGFNVIIPVYKENPDVFKTCLKSIRDRSPNRLIVSIDGGDHEMRMIAEEFADHIIILPKTGKRKAMLNAVPYIDFDSPVTIIVDSDTIWTDTTLNMLKPFQDPSIGGVTGRHRIFDPSKTIARIVADWLEQIRFDLVVPAQAYFGKVLCLPGRTLALRTDIFVDSIESVANRKILGIDIMIGDDRDLTTEIIKKGYKTVYQKDSLVWTDCPNTMKKLSLQQLRWYRSVMRETIIQIPLYTRKAFLPWFWSLEFIMAPSFLVGIFLGDLFRLTFSIYDYMPFAFEFPPNQKALFISSLSVLGFFGGYYIKQLPHYIKRRDLFFFLPLFVLCMFIWIFPVKLNAVFTFLEQGWNTRNQVSFSSELNIFRTRLISFFIGLVIFLPFFLLGFFVDLRLTGLELHEITFTPLWQNYDMQLINTQNIQDLRNLTLLLFITCLLAVGYIVYSHEHNLKIIRSFQLKTVSLLTIFVLFLTIYIPISSIRLKDFSQFTTGVLGAFEEQGRIMIQGEYVRFSDDVFTILNLLVPSRFVTREIEQMYPTITNESLSDTQKRSLSFLVRNEMARARRADSENLVLQIDQIRSLN